MRLMQDLRAFYRRKQNAPSVTLLEIATVTADTRQLFKHDVYRKKKQQSISMQKV